MSVGSVDGAGQVIGQKIYLSHFSPAADDILVDDMPSLQDSLLPISRPATTTQAYRSECNKHTMPGPQKHHGETKTMATSQTIQVPMQ